MQSRQARETGICPVREELYCQCFGTYTELFGHLFFIFVTHIFSFSHLVLSSHILISFSHFTSSSHSLISLFIIRFLLAFFCNKFIPFFFLIPASFQLFLYSFFLLYFSAIITDELIRQITINCAERGLLLLRVRDEARMTIAGAAVNESNY